MFRSQVLILLLGLFPAVAQADILIEDAYARAASPAATSGTVYMTLRNTGPQTDHLISARSPIAAKAVLHRNIEDADGMMRMIAVTDGLDIDVGCAARLERGGDHLMFMGLTAEMTQGSHFPLTLSFEKAGDITIDVPVDMTHVPGAVVISGHVNHDHSGMDDTATSHEAMHQHNTQMCAMKIAD
ncbi:copper chaperone PCu(A)C [Pseudooceanicola spongiae]|uniref:Copper chaperone PCu(A)C n=1 Tax=Pseudooceanicola spongiae TaxID=2613965 RepID=A0A7L9WU29_9RHOB|nr:copper chaperone PCu(A)C [Pseudooceanicola spongiae]QOL82590.1 copper chaperone PCu(A)C [Pseudooceanicola spongiae]